MSISLLTRIVTTSVCAFAIGTAFAADIAAGAAKAKQVCAACHGEDGNAAVLPEYPKLGGQHADYLLRTLRDYKSGARKNAVMAAIAQPLTDKEMRDLAAYFASRPGSLYVKR